MQATSKAEHISFAGSEFTIRCDDTKPSYFGLGVRKAGSSIMNSMLAALAQWNDVNFVDIPGELFKAGVEVSTWQADGGLAKLVRGGNIYGGFRNAPTKLMDWPGFDAPLKILLVRDPRDALVSEYFSNAHSHSLPKSGTTLVRIMEEREKARQWAIEDYVFKMVPSYRDTLRQYAPFLGLKNLRVYKYERAILDKRWFLGDVCEHFGWTVTDHQLELIMSWAHVVPETEVPTQFIRKVKPGDHREKLSLKAINVLNQELRDELNMFGYSVF
jgi:hypothetical protein